MASCSITGFDELEKILRKLEQPEKMAIKAVDAASPVLVSALKGAINAATKGGHGDLAGSIEATSARQNELGVFSAVRPTGTDRKGVRNGEKLAYLEYGVKSHHQPPRPVRQAAVAAAEGACMSIIEGIIEQEVGSL